MPRDGHATVDDLVAYLDQYIGDPDTILVLRAQDTVDLEGAVALEVALEEIEAQAPLLSGARKADHGS